MRFIKVMLKLIIVFIISFQTIDIKSQNSEFKDNLKHKSGMSEKDFQNHMLKIDSLRKIDYLSYNYKYIISPGGNYKIAIPEGKFDEVHLRFKFYTPKTSMNQSDSLYVVLMAEFNDWDEARISHHRITYSWLRVGYYLWKTPEQSQLEALKFGFIHPYRFISYLLYSNEEDKNKSLFLSDLKQKIYDTTKDSVVLEKNGSKLLNYALLKNPKRIKDFNELKKKRLKQRKGKCLHNKGGNCEHK